MVDRQSRRRSLQRRSRPAGHERRAAPILRLREMIRAHVAVVTSTQKDAAVFQHEWRFLSAAARQMSARRDAYEALFRQVIERGHRWWVFQPVDPRLTAMAILSALNGIASWYSAEGALVQAEIADQHADLFLSALTCSTDKR